MIWGAYVGQRVQVWYGPGKKRGTLNRNRMPFHACVGNVVAVGRPRNLLVQLDYGGPLVVVPAGYLRKSW